MDAPSVEGLRELIAHLDSKTALPEVQSVAQRRPSYSMLSVHLLNLAGGRRQAVRNERGLV